MSIKFNTHLLVDAIIGKGFLSMSDADHATKLGLAKFTGDQWNEKWEWRRDELNKLSFEHLCLIYDRQPNSVFWSVS